MQPKVHQATLQAIGQYESARQQHVRLFGTVSFDVHDKAFAVENQVCPRCSKAGNFDVNAGNCDCGFFYH